MAGKIHRMINEIIQERSQGNKAIMSTTMTKMIIKGVNPKKFNETSEDDPIVIGKIQLIAKEFGINNLNLGR